MLHVSRGSLPPCNAATRRRGNAPVALLTFGLVQSVPAARWAGGAVSVRSLKIFEFIFNLRPVNASVRKGVLIFSLLFFALLAAHWAVRTRRQRPAAATAPRGSAAITL